MLTEELSGPQIDEALRTMLCPACGSVLLEYLPEGVAAAGPDDVRTFYCPEHKEDAFVASVVPGVLEELTEADA
jgi:hypothetical protein